MCGICGIFEPRRNQCPDSELVRKMTDTMTHRGPDAGDVYCGPGIGLGHRRLSIIDLEGGKQPLSNEDETVWVVFNGEIYNFESLNRQYLSSGHTFRTRSDTETIVHLYEELGEECFSKFGGMFSIALWDSRERKLFLARDRVGKKPLYYSWDGSSLLFGSEIKALSAAPGFNKDIDIQAVSDFFSFQYIPSPKTIYKNVRKVKPGHYLVVTEHGIRESCYWDISFDEQHERSENDWCDRLLTEYRGAVQSRLISDVPLGAFLSGGVDSSSVVALMSDIQRPVTTCSVGFAEEKYDETAQARDYAASLQTNHYEDRVNPGIVDILPKLAWHYDEPFADSSAVPTYYVCKMARQHVTVALSGDGGDESFAGYKRYRWALDEDRLRSRVPSALRSTLMAPLAEHYPAFRKAPRILRAKSVLQSMARTPLAGYFHLISCCPPALKHRLFTADVTEQLAGYDSIDVLQPFWDRTSNLDLLSRLQYLDIKTYLTDDILVKVDRASMANSLEVRCPLLDQNLMQLAATVPSSLKLRNGKGKYILKKAISRYVPDTILNGAKRGFAVPVAEWFRSGELRNHACQNLFLPHDILNIPFLMECWNEHQSGARDWSALLWCALMFRTWEDAVRN